MSDRSNNYAAVAYVHINRSERQNESKQSSKRHYQSI